MADSTRALDAAVRSDVSRPQSQRRRSWSVPRVVQSSVPVATATMGVGESDGFEEISFVQVTSSPWHPITPRASGMCAHPIRCNGRSWRSIYIVRSAFTSSAENLVSVTVRMS